jgi:hypothetical protein
MLARVDRVLMRLALMFVRADCVSVRVWAGKLGVRACILHAGAFLCRLRDCACRFDVHACRLRVVRVD